MHRWGEGRPRGRPLVFCVTCNAARGRLAFHVRRSLIHDAFHEELCNFNLIAAAHADMIEHGFQPDFPAGTDTELAKIKAQPELPSLPDVQDLRESALVFDR